MDDLYAIVTGASGAIGAVGYVLGRWRGKRQQKIAVLEQRLVDLEKEQDLKLLALEKNVQTMVTSLGATSNDLKTQLEHDGALLRKQLEQLEARLAEVSTRLDGKFASAVERVDVLRAEMGAMFRQAIKSVAESLQGKIDGHETKLIDLERTQDSKLHALEKALASSSAVVDQNLQAKADVDRATQEEVVALREQLAALKTEQDGKLHDLEKAHGLKLLSNEKDVAEGKAYSTALEVEVVGLHGELRSQIAQLEARTAQANALHDEGQKKRLDEVIVELNQKLTVVTSELHRKLASTVLERTVREVLELKHQEPAEPELEISIDLIKAAVDEQERREGNHPLSYRDDQSVQAVQQRLSRDVGERAFGAATRFAIVKELKKRDMV